MYIYISISTWSYKNRVSKHFVICRNLRCLPSSITGVQASGVIIDRLLRQCSFVWSEIVGPHSSGNYNDSKTIQRFAKTWLQKSLLYTLQLSLVVEQVFFFFFIVAFNLFNRYRIGHSRQTLMSFSLAFNLLPPPPLQKKKCFS